MTSVRGAAGKQNVLIEALYYAGGLKSKLYGHDNRARPSWLPASDRVGLHNDVFPGPGQWVADYSRFEYADGKVSPHHGLTWIGVYTHAVDIYGDRGNFCGVGAWLLEGVVLNHEHVVETLLALTEFLQANLPEDGIAQLPELFDLNCEKALKYLCEECVLGHAQSLAGLPAAGHHSAECSYVVLPQKTLDASELAPVFDVLAVADVPVRTPRVLFIAGEDVKFDAKVRANKRLSGFQSVLGAERANDVLVGNIIGVGFKIQQAVRSVEESLEESNARLRDSEVTAGTLREKLGKAEGEIHSLEVKLKGAIAPSRRQRDPPLSTQSADIEKVLVQVNSISTRLRGVEALLNARQPHNDQQWAEKSQSSVFESLLSLRPQLLVLGGAMALAIALLSFFKPWSSGRAETEAQQSGPVANEAPDAGGAAEVDTDRTPFGD
jgi:hypothetical protein